MSVPRSLPIAAGIVGLLLLASCGSDDDSIAVPNGDSGTVIEVEMRDIAFSPTSIDVEAGDTVRFVFTNTGKLTHEAYIGDAAAQQDHADEMASMGGMDHGGDDVLTVEPGNTGELTHTFDDAGTVQIGCHEPSHFEAGMVMDVAVS